MTTKRTPDEETIPTLTEAQRREIAERKVGELLIQLAKVERERDAWKKRAEEAESK